MDSRKDIKADVVQAERPRTYKIRGRLVPYHKIKTVLTVTADAACLRRASVEIAPYSSACDSERTKCAGRAG